MRNGEPETTNAGVSLAGLRREVRALGDSKRAEGVARFFKTGPGEYGEGDKFLGLTVPMLRKLSRGARGLSLDDAVKLLHSEWHEERLLALLLMVDAHERGTQKEKGAIRRAYLANTRYINNWDLVDASAGEIVGHDVAHTGTKTIERLVKSKSLWERRIAMIATFYGIKRSEFDPALQIAAALLKDEHDLIHKAVGWMLREVGKKDVEVLRAFLREHAATMPRTALRYAIERMSAAERRRFMDMRAVSAGRSAKQPTTRRHRSAE